VEQAPVALELLDEPAMVPEEEEEEEVLVEMALVLSPLDGVALVEEALALSSLEDMAHAEVEGIHAAAA
jgi:hypothetical protein